MGEVVFIISFLVGFLVYKKLSIPKSRLFHSHHLVPNVEIKHIEILPCLRIPLGKGRFGGKRHLHIHHWIYLGLLLVISLFIDNRLTGNLSLVNGLCLGGIAQGLTYHDRFKLKE